jgi:dienelactone hydrolase
VLTIAARAGVLVATLLTLASCLSTNAAFQTRSLGSSRYVDPQMVTAMLFTPQGKGPFPAVVLLHTCGGPSPHVTQDWPDYLTGLGYAVLTVDSYGPRGFTSCSRMGYLRYLVQAEDALGALDYLATVPSVDANRVAAIGFSAGAIAINDNLVNYRPQGRFYRALIALYGRCTNIFGHGRDSVPLMEIAAEHDVNHAPSCIEAGKTWPSMEVRVLPGAYHSFDSDHRGGRYDTGGSYMLYSASATAQARALVKDFLARHLAEKGPTARAAP